MKKAASFSLAAFFGRDEATFGLGRYVPSFFNSMFIAK